MIIITKTTIEFINNINIPFILNINNTNGGTYKNAPNANPNNIDNNGPVPCFIAFTSLSQSNLGVNMFIHNPSIEYINTNIKSNLDSAKKELNSRIDSIDTSTFATKEEIELKSDSNHTHNDLHSHVNKAVLDLITTNDISRWNAKSNFSGKYEDLSGKPTIPSLDGYMKEAEVRALIKTIVLDGYLGGKQLRFANDSGVDGYVTFQKG